MKKIYQKHGDGIQEDPNLVIEFDPLFKSVLGTGINRRELLKVGAALGGAAMAQPTFAAKRKWDPVIKIGYIPITDAAALLIAHDLGFFKNEGIDSRLGLLACPAVLQKFFR